MGALRVIITLAVIDRELQTWRPHSQFVKCCLILTFIIADIVRVTHHDAGLSVPGPHLTVVPDTMTTNPVESRTRFHAQQIEQPPEFENTLPWFARLVEQSHEVVPGPPDLANAEILSEYPTTSIDLVQPLLTLGLPTKILFILRTHPHRKLL
jgi:hypothetical protein